MRSPPRHDGPFRPDRSDGRDSRSRTGGLSLPKRALFLLSYIPV